MRFAARMQKKEWSIRPKDERCDELAKALNVSPILAQVLINREVSDVATAKSFLNPRLTELISPEKMPGVKKAVERISKAIDSKEKITIYGDYDVDGITGVSILLQAIKLFDGDVDYYIPHRIDEGYGLNSKAVESLGKSGTELLITVDCGIGAVEPARLARQLGIDLIITDHHQRGEQLPEAISIVHAGMNESYANQNCCGAMVAFKLAWAIANKFKSGARLEPRLRDFMLNATSLAAVGTIADIMDLRGENRVLTNYGLKSLPGCNLSGIQALIAVAGLTGKGLDSFDIGFRLGPMLNAAGRMGHGRLAVELLTSDSSVRSMHIAEYLKQQNEQRRRLERKIFKQACEMVMEKGLNHPDRKSIVLAGEGWHHGVIGIVASRIVDKYYRPTIILNTSDAVVKGSGRSIEGFDLLKAIGACSKHLKSFGGHKMAAGVTLEAEKIEDFAADLEKYADENLNHEDTIAKIDIDAEVGLEAFSENVVRALEQLGPFGRGNPEPVFATKGVRLISNPRKVGAKGEHLQIAITDNSHSVRCIGFGMGKLEKKLLEHDSFDVAYQPQMNSYNGNTNVQLVLTDIQFD